MAGATSVVDSVVDEEEDRENPEAEEGPPTTIEELATVGIPTKKRSMSLYLIHQTTSTTTTLIRA